MADWRDLAEELDRWGEAGRVATFWWRDDDAGPDDGLLVPFLDQRRRLAAPLALAVVPAWLEPATAAAIRSDPGACVLQHGAAHANRAPAERRKMELCVDVAPAGLDAALSDGHSALARAFGSRFHAVMVPPWNRIDDTVVSRLAGLGFCGLSTLGPRRAARAHGLACANVHVDIIDWQARRCRGDAAAVAAALDHLRARRAGDADAGEPTGLMTHHRVHDAACRDLVDRFVTTVRDHPAARWVDAAETFAEPRKA